MSEIPTFHIEKLQLDLRGLPRATAEAVPAHLREALTQALLRHPPATGQHPSPPGPLRITVDPGDSNPLGIAENIAQSLVQSLRSGDPAHPDRTSTLT